RGRVGRGANRAYAYFFYPKGRELTEAAENRLRTIAQATELGSGFRIAMKDLEIRGAGNLLGPEQSGQIGAVGFDLYSRLLAEAVEELKAKMGQGGPAAPKLPAPTIDLPLPAHIPQDYIDDEATRQAHYQRMALLSSPQEAEDMAREMEDRFGPLPRPAQNLLYVVRVKALAARAGFSSLGQEEGQLVLRLREGLELDTPHLPFPGQPWLKASSHQLRLDLKRLGPRWPEMLERLLKAMGGKA
ncbi:MAG: transcription-repair coupling factor, partial [Chloroflexota bacterium]|nr:transcription-repair coupling factor [Chloroflexota bacterium]